MKRKYAKWLKGTIAVTVIYALIFQQAAYCLEQITVGYGKEYATIQNAVDSHPFDNPLTDDLEFRVDVGGDGYAHPHDISIEDFGVTNGKEIVFTGVPVQTISGKRKDFLLSSEGEQLGVLKSSGSTSQLGKIVELTPTASIKEIHTEDGNYDYTVALLTDQTGTVVRQVQLKTSNPDHAAYLQHAYGQPVAGPDGLQKSGDQVQGIDGFSFTGKSLDTDLRASAESDRAGLYYFGARFFDPELGIWLTPDPAGVFNDAYTYGNDPVNTVDPDGREPLTIGAILIGALIVGAVIGAGVGAYQGYKMAMAEGATGWEMVGYIAGGTLIGAVSGGVGGVAAAGAGILTAMGCVACAPAAAWVAGTIVGSLTGSALNKAAYGTDLSVTVGLYNFNLEGGEHGGFPQYTDWDSPTGFIDNTLTTLAYLGPVLAVAGAVSPKMNPFANIAKSTPNVAPAAKNVPDENAVPKLNLNERKEINPVKKDVAQVTKNRINGKLAEKKFRDAAARSSRVDIAGEQVYVKTSQTVRIVDFVLVDKKTGTMMAYEIKSGNAARDLTQIMKDQLIETEGGIIRGGKLGPAGNLRIGERLQVHTREINIKAP